MTERDRDTSPTKQDPGVAAVRRDLADRRLMLPQIVRRNAVDHRAARSRQHSWEQFYDERRLEVDETAIGEQARHHVGVLRRRLGSERGERPGWQTEVEPERKNMPCPHTRADANHLRM